MWKNTPETQPPARTTPPTPAAAPPPAPPATAPRSTDRPTHLSKSVALKGTITGSEDLYIDGKVEGTVELPNNSVTVGVNGQVQANIIAREVIILGKLNGNVTAADRVDIRAHGALTGDVSAARISIEDGAFFKGGIDIRKGAAAGAPPQAVKAAF